MLIIKWLYKYNNIELVNPFFHETSENLSILKITKSSFFNILHESNFYLNVSTSGHRVNIPLQNIKFLICLILSNLIYLPNDKFLAHND